MEKLTSNLMFRRMGRRWGLRDLSSMFSEDGEGQERLNFEKELLRILRAQKGEVMDSSEARY